MTDRPDRPVDLDRERRVAGAVADLRDVLDGNPALRERTRAMLAGALRCPALEESMNGADEQMSIRVPEGTQDRAEALIPALDGDAEFRVLRCTKSAILRLAVLRGLDLLESEHPKGKRRSG
jgi:hypothetical protein